MLDAIVDYLPSPVDIPPVKGARGWPRGSGSLRRPDPSEPFAALAFKIMSDQHLGKLTYIRIYSGTLESGSNVLTPPRGAGADRQDLPDAREQREERARPRVAGQIVAGHGAQGHLDRGHPE